MNNFSGVGRLTKDPELKYIQNTGTAVTRFTIAISRDYKDKDGNYPTDFLPVEIMGKPAEYVANYIQKGYLVSIKGEVRVDRYTTDTGENRSFTKIFVNAIKNLTPRVNSEKGEFKPSNDTPPEFSAVDDDDVPF